MMNPANRKPPDFDWVKARSECCAVEVFEKLKGLVQRDVTAINERRKGESVYFKFIPGNSNRFSVAAMHEMDFQRKNVDFTLANEEIVIAGADERPFTVTVGLGDDGECRAKIDGQEYDLWQVRKRALEELFFRGSS